MLCAGFRSRCALVVALFPFTLSLTRASVDAAAPLASAAEAQAEASWDDATFEAFGYVPADLQTDYVLIEYRLGSDGQLEAVRGLRTTRMEVVETAIEAVIDTVTAQAPARNGAGIHQRIVYFAPGSTQAHIHAPLAELARVSPAAYAGDPVAQNRIGELYYHALAGEVRDFDRAFRWFTLAADQGNPDAQFNLGVLYQFGQGVPVDPAKAVFWYRQAAQAGQPNALNNLAYAYSAGLGVHADQNLALAYYHQAANLGQLSSLYTLGRRAENGEGQTRDFELAARYYEQAGAKGHAKALFSLGRLYELGRGVARDLSAARHCYAEAARQGLEPAARRLRELDLGQLASGS